MNTANRTLGKAPYVPQIRLYQNWLRDQRGLSFANYHDLWRWSVTDLDAFWQSIWDYFELLSPTPHTAVLASNVMPGAQWFVGAKTNYAHQVFRHVKPAHQAGLTAVISHNEKGLRREISWPELRRQVAALALHLQALGVQPGDRVAAYLPNIPEAMVAFLATASVGGIWSICAPDMGTHAVLDRFKQIEPKVLIAVDGVSYGGRDFDRMTVVQELKDALPSVQHVIVHENLGTLDLASCDVAASVQMSAITARDDAEVQAFEPLSLSFDHPLWIVYSSGTTGLPKPIVHGHGGTVIVALANKILHNDVGCSYHPNSFGERFHWYSSTGWVMWNAQVAGLLNGVTCVIYDGSPGGSKDNVDWGILWRMAAQEKVTFFGAGAAYFANCQKAQLDIGRCGDLSRVRALGTTGSPLSPETQNWGTAQFEKIGTDIWWCNISGGTDAGAYVAQAQQHNNQASGRPGDPAFHGASGVGGGRACGRAHAQAMQDVVDLRADVLLGGEDFVGQRARAHGVVPQHQEHHGRQHDVGAVVQVHLAELAALHAALQNAPDERTAGQNHLLLVELRDLREVLGLAEHQLGDARCLGGANAFPPHLIAVSQHLAGGADKGLQLGIPLGKAACNVFTHHGFEQFFLAGEVQKQRAFGHPGAGRHLVHAGSGKAFFDEQIQRRLQQFARARFFASAAFGGSFAGGGIVQRGRGHFLLTDWLVM